MKYALLHYDNLVNEIIEVSDEIGTYETIIPLTDDSIIVEKDYYYDRDTGTFRPPTKDELLARYKWSFNNQRDLLFSQSNWIRQRHTDRIDLGIDDTNNWTAWLNYWQALRDLPEWEDFDPRNPQWPTKPE